jgi:uncharacterized protein with NAD-binding domain and iron-sulfur cluster
MQFTISFTSYDYTGLPMRKCVMLLLLFHYTTLTIQAVTFGNRDVTCCYITQQQHRQIRRSHHYEQQQHYTDQLRYRFTNKSSLVRNLWRGNDVYTNKRLSDTGVLLQSSIRSDEETSDEAGIEQQQERQTQQHGSKKRRHVVVIGGGWGGLSAAHRIAQQQKHRTTIGNNEDEEENCVDVTVIEASSRVGGLVRDGYTTVSGNRQAEAGQHGFWNNYYNIYHLLRKDLTSANVTGGGKFSIEQALTEFAEQGQYSPAGLQAIWPVYQKQSPNLPTGLAQGAYTQFLKLPLIDRISAFPLVLAFSEFDDSAEAWNTYDKISFRDLCIKLGVSKRCYDEAFEPMILTGLFAPGHECSAAAALGMAYFFVLQSQNAFDVQWCRGNIGTVIFDPWVSIMKENGVKFLCNTRVTGFQIDSDTIATTPKITSIKCTSTNPSGDTTNLTIDVDEVIFAVGAKSLNAFVRFSPELAKLSEFRRFANLRGTSVLATRLFLDRKLSVPYSANACWGFDQGIGMTMFDISTLHGPNSSTVQDSPGSVIEVDYYYANKLLCMSDEDIIVKVKNDLDIILGHRCWVANVTDAAIVRLPEAVNWYYPGSYQDMPDVQATSLGNVYFAGDIVRTRHGSWSQEKAFVTGIQAANLILKRPINENVIPLPSDEIHVRLGRTVVTKFRQLLAGPNWDTHKNKNFDDAVNEQKKLPSLVDFLR